MTIKHELFLMVFLFSTISISFPQTPNGSDKNTFKFQKESSNLNTNRNPLEYSFCDLDGDGQIELNIARIRQDVLGQTGLGNGDSESIFISTDQGTIVKISNPNFNPSFEVICQFQSRQTDVAVNEAGEFFATSFSSIYSLNPETCSRSILFSFPFGFQVNSLSFDTAGNLYYGTGNGSEVFRDDAGGGNNAYVWHNFEEGSAGGDFVMLNQKMYIAWVINDTNRLYEITVDANFNYISHVDLGQTPPNTYGLASELGKLYGVTPGQLYEIDLDNFTFNTIINNDGDYGEWWGASGLHEAIQIEVSAHPSKENANNDTNPLPDTWINPIPGGQIIYIRIENIESGEFIIIPVTINIFNTPQITQPSDLNLCTDDGAFGLFLLTEVEEELLQNVDGKVEVSYHGSSGEAENNSNPLDPIYQSINNSETIFARVQNTSDFCYAITEFKLFSNPAPGVAPLVNQAIERILNNCYINKFDDGYFILTEIYEQIVTDNNDGYDLQFYNSYENAIEDSNALPDTYFSMGLVIEEIFVKVINAEGCESISNFFIDGNCVCTTLDISGIHFPEYFTPNGDAFHELWTVRGVSKEIKKATLITVYDRYGKQIYQFHAGDNSGWDGTYNGKPMPSSDYWFTISTIDGRSYTGHFTLKR